MKSARMEWPTFTLLNTSFRLREGDTIQISYYEWLLAHSNSWLCLIIIWENAS